MFLMLRKSLRLEKMEMMIFLVAKKNTSTKVQVVEEVDALGLEEISGTMEPP